MKLILRLLINAVAIWAASEFVSGVTLDTTRVGAVIAVVLVFAVVNALVKPIVKFFSFPFVVLTLGLFSLVINAGLFALVAWFTQALSVSGFWPAFWGSIIVSIVSWLLSLFVNDDDDEDD